MQYLIRPVPQLALLPSGTFLNLHFPQLALPKLTFFANYFCAIKNLSPPTAGTSSDIYIYKNLAFLNANF